MSWSVSASGSQDEVIAELGEAGLSQPNCPSGVIGDIKGLIKHLGASNYTVSASGHSDDSGSNLEVKISATNAAPIADEGVASGAVE